MATGLSAGLMLCGTQRLGCSGLFASEALSGSPKAPLAICRPTVRAGRRAAHGLSESGGAGCDKVQRGGPMIRCGTFFAENSFEPIGDPADVKRPLGIKSPVRP